MTMRDDRVKERPIMKSAPVNYQHHTDEWKCRQFAQIFPSREMGEAVKYCEAGYYTWHHLYLMIRESSLVAAEEVVSDNGFGIRDTEPNCNTPEHSGFGRLGEPLSNPLNEISDRWYPR
jgi:hypothetical protein